MLAHDLISRVSPKLDANLGAEFIGQSAMAMMSAYMRDKEPQSIKIIAHSNSTQNQWHCRPDSGRVSSAI
jgi:hypothetical protein